MSSAFAASCVTGTAKNGRLVIKLHLQSQHSSHRGVKVDKMTLFAFQMEASDHLMSWDVDHSGYGQLLCDETSIILLLQVKVLLLPLYFTPV